MTDTDDAIKVDMAIRDAIASSEMLLEAVLDNRHRDQVAMNRAFLIEARDRLSRVLSATNDFHAFRLNAHKR